MQPSHSHLSGSSGMHQKTAASHLSKIGRARSPQFWAYWSQESGKQRA